MITPLRRDDTGSLPIAMLLTLVGVGLSVIMLNTVLTTVRNTRFEVSRAAALGAARDGLAAAVANLRTARDEDGIGSLSSLPCGTGSAQVSGTVHGGAAEYSVSILYLLKDPSQHDAAWAAANGTPCPTSLGGVPKFARLSSVGVDRVGGHRRTLYGTYTFKTGATANMPGGEIRMWKLATDTNLLCMDAGAAPMAGIEVRMEPCATLPNGTASSRQKFAYLPNLTIALVTANPTVNPNGLCLDAGAPHAAQSVVRLQACGTSTLPQQQWSFNSASGFFGTTDGKTLDSNCFSVENPDTPGSRVMLNDTSGGLANGNPACNKDFPNNVQSWNPQPDVGAGAAGLSPTKQVVNFQQFGRCLDVTYMDVTKPYEVSFPCKQTPVLTDRDWNQQWDLPADGTGALSTDAPEGRYCLTLPPIGPQPMFVTVTPCKPGQPPENQNWWVRGSDTASYDEAYRIEGTGTHAGYCLAPLPTYPAWQQADKIGLVPCDGSKIQKWNAQPGSDPAGLSNIGEL